MRLSLHEFKDPFEVIVKFQELSGLFFVACWASHCVKTVAAKPF